MKNKKQFFSDSIFDQLILNRFRYKGIGRPRKTDYTKAKTIQNKINLVTNYLLNKKLIEQMYK